MNPIPVVTDNAHHIPREYPGLSGVSWLSYPELVSVMSQLPTCGELIEVGTASGVTAAVLATNRPQLSITCLDIFAESHAASPDCCADRLPGVDRRNDWYSNAKPNMELVQSTLAEYVKLRSIVECYVLVDGDHEYDGVARDLAVLADFRNPVIFCHDYGCSTWPGVRVAVDEFLAANSDYRMTNRCNSLVTLRRL